VTSQRVRPARRAGSGQQARHRFAPDPRARLRDHRRDSVAQALRACITVGLLRLDVGILQVHYDWQAVRTRDPQGDGTRNQAIQ
jgi:hypothetical protein